MRSMVPDYAAYPLRGSSGVPSALHNHEFGLNQEVVNPVVRVKATSPKRNCQDCHELRKDRDYLQEENEELREKWREAADELQMLKSSTYFGLDDSYFETNFLELCFQIRQFASEHFEEISGAPWANKERSMSVDVRMNDRFRALPDDQKIFKDRQQPLSMLKQSFIWRFLYENVFRDDTLHDRETWAGDVRKQIHELEQAFLRSENDDPQRGDRMKMYHIWRASTAAVFCANPDYQSGVAKHAEQLSTSLYTFIEPDVRNPSGRIEKDIRKLVQSAIHLDADMRKQRAYFWLSFPELRREKIKGSWHTRPVSFDSPSMAPSMSDQTREPPFALQSVLLVLSPALLKEGDAYGQSYDVKICLVKAQVLLDKDRPARKVRRKVPSSQSPPGHDNTKRPHRADDRSKHNAVQGISKVPADHLHNDVDQRATSSIRQVVNESASPMLVPNELRASSQAAKADQSASRTTPDKSGSSWSKLKGGLKDKLKLTESGPNQHDIVTSRRS